MTEEQPTRPESEPVAVTEAHVALLAAEQRAAQAEHRLHSFRQGRAARSKVLAEFIKARAPELWADYAAISVNGSIYSDELTVEPTYEREMNILRHRAEKAEEELAAIRARAEQPTRPDMPELIAQDADLIDCPAPSGDAVEVWEKAYAAYIRAPFGSLYDKDADQAAAAIIEAAINARCEPLVKALEEISEDTENEYGDPTWTATRAKYALAQHRGVRP